MATFQGTLDNYGIDPTDPMSGFPVGFDKSLSTYGAYWKFKAQPATHTTPELDRIFFDYAVFTGNAPDVFGAYVPFGFQSRLVWLVSDMDVDIDYTINNVNSYRTYWNIRYNLIYLSASGFRIRNSVAGSNSTYQLVVYR